MHTAGKVTNNSNMSDATEATAMELSGQSTSATGDMNGVAVVAGSGAAVAEKSAADEEMKAGVANAEETNKIESESSEEESDESDDEKDDGPTMPAAPPPVRLTDVNGRPLSDFEVAARYAAIEIQSMASQLASTVVDTSKPASAPVVKINSSNGASGDNAMKDNDGDDKDDDDEVLGNAAPAAESSDDDDSSDDEDLGGDDDPRKLRAEIEAAMEKEENKASGPLKTVNEVAAVPVREPEIQELTPDCPIARFGTILNVSRPGLIVTIKSDHGVKPLDEGSVLCFEDRTVLGCVDEVFGPVLMPMYLVRFENADKIPAQTDLNKSVYYVTEHTTYIVPEKIRDKGTDASNIFDEETDEVIYSDDESEAAAKRQNRKRNRGGDNATGAGAPSSTSGPSGNFSDYQAGEGGQQGGRGRGGRGGSRGGRGGRGDRGGRGQSIPGYQHQHHGPVPVQAQPHGGYTRYTTPGYGQPGMSQGYPPASGPYPLAQPPLPPSYGGAPQYQQQHNQYGHMQTQPMPMYQHQQQYGAPPHLPPYPPQAPPPPNYYAQPQSHGYPQPPPPPPPPGHYGAPPPAGYYQQQQPDPNAYGHQGLHHPPPPPPPPSGPYGSQGGRRH